MFSRRFTRLTCVPHRLRELARRFLAVLREEVEVRARVVQRRLRGAAGAGRRTSVRDRRRPRRRRSRSRRSRTRRRSPRHRPRRDGVCNTFTPSTMTMSGDGEHDLFVVDDVVREVRIARRARPWARRPSARRGTASARARRSSRGSARAWPLRRQGRAQPVRAGHGGAQGGRQDGEQHPRLSGRRSRLPCRLSR